MAKRKTQRKVSDKDSCEYSGCHCRNILIRIGAMAFILLLMTIWSGLRVFLMNVPWWVYLIIWVLFCGAAMGMRNKCWCCKK
jgi:hypothetical protein